MKKFFLAVTIVILSTTNNYYTVIKKKPEILSSSLARSINSETNEPIETDNRFLPYETEIFYTVNIKDFPENTKLNATWKYLKGGTETQNVLYTGGSGYRVFMLKRDYRNFSPGSYEVTVTGAAGDTLLKTSSKFEILQDSPAVNITTPITCRSIDDEEHLNPENVTSEFSTQEKQIYFLLQSSLLPENSVIKCTWEHMDTGTSISSKITAEGSKTIAFYLKCNDGITLPEGTYTVTASTIIDNKVQSVQRVFEVQ